ncbi:MAG: hypothetical protein Kow0049_32110 [Stanieria sp.]
MQYKNTLTKNDRWIVEHIFPNEYSKYFIEAGACNGIEASSCYVLEKYFHWTGICIEPNDNYFQELIKNRPNSICENKCLSDRSGIVTYIQGESNQINPMLSGIKSHLIKYKSNSQEIISKGQEIQKESISLYELLKKHNAPQVIHYLAMDIEGSELSVLKVFPFEKYKILAISVEGIACNDLLVAKGYVNVKNPFNPDQLYEQFFLHQSIAIEKQSEINANHYISLGNNFSLQQKASAAIAAYQQALKIEPYNSTIYVQLANYQKQQGYLTEAVASYRQAIKLEPLQPDWVYYTLGNILKQQNKLNEALVAYQKAIEIQPQQPAWLYHTLGDTLQKQNRLDEALVAYQKAIEIQPQQPDWVYRCLGYILHQKGQLEQALVAYQKAIEIDPQQPDWVSQSVDDLFKRKK